MDCRDLSHDTGRARAQSAVRVQTTSLEFTTMHRETVCATAFAMPHDRRATFTRAGASDAEKMEAMSWTG